MRFDVTLGGATRRVEVRRVAGGYRVEVDGEAVDVDARRSGAGQLSLLIGGRSHEVGLAASEDGYTVFLGGRAYPVAVRPASAGGAAARPHAAGPARLVAPMPGKIVQVLRRPGDEVAMGEGLVVMEAMKMENELKTPRAGRVSQIAVTQGQAVETGALLALVE